MNPGIIHLYETKNILLKVKKTRYHQRRKLILENLRKPYLISIVDDLESRGNHFHKVKEVEGHCIDLKGHSKHKNSYEIKCSS